MFSDIVGSRYMIVTYIAQMYLPKMYQTKTISQICLAVVHIQRFSHVFFQNTLIGDWDRMACKVIVINAFACICVYILQ